jgi:predicted DNA-binding protein
MNNYHNDTTINIRLPIELKKRMQAAAELELLSQTAYIKRLMAKDAKRLGL